MQLRHQTILCAVVAAVLPSGCGTVMNLMSPVEGPPYRTMLDSICQPFGGVTQSMGCGVLCLAYGLNVGGEDIGKGGLLMGAGMAAREWTHRYR
jgi:hypothetical protein